MDTINLYSDTQTLPTPEMYRAMTTAPLGDDIQRNDPTVLKLEAMAAQKLGKEAALLTISGNMANLVALICHANPGDEVLIDPESHIAYYESGSMASVAGLMPRNVPSHRGLMNPEDVTAALRPANVHFPTPRLFCLENTHNRGGGRVVPLDLHRALCQTARSHGLSIHLDGARIFNASVASGHPVTDYTRDVDSVMFCLSKGLSCPLGSVLCGSKKFIDKAERVRKRLGGGMRQAGVIAACGIVALESMIDRLAEDHANAKRLAHLLHEIPRLKLNIDEVETNMLCVDVSLTGLSSSDFIQLLASHNVLVSQRSPTEIRIVTNRHHTPGLIEETARRMRRAIASLRP